MNIKFYSIFETSLRNCGTIRDGGGGLKQS
jgi:hypothetical protein